MSHTDCLHIDFETRSTVDLRKTGVHKYAADATTGIWCLAWALGNQPVQSWVPGRPPPFAALDHIAGGGKVFAHNAPFELTIWNHCLRTRVDSSWPELRADQTFCTMAMAQALALPAGLGNLAIALGLPEEKDKEGRALMLRMAKPRKVQPDGTIVWWDDPAKLNRLIAYCENDVVVERAIGAKLPSLSPAERATWLLDREINERGIALDIPSIMAADDMVSDEAARLGLELFQLTNGRVESVTQVADICAWLRENGFPECHSIARPEVERMLDETGDAVTRRVLEIRQLAGKASVKKLPAMLASTDLDGRARELFGYHGASTGRWTGRRVQPQNLPRPKYKFEDVEQIIDHLGDAHSAELIDMCFGAPIDAVSSCLRSMFCAGPGHELIASDFSNIEGRMLAWLAGETWKLDAFRDYDAGIGPDLYILAYARSFGLDPKTIDKHDPRRQIGKVMELALGYQGGLGAFISMGANYGLKVVETPRILVDPNAPIGKRYRPATVEDLPELPKLPEGTLYELEVHQFKKAWRQAHPNIKAFWRALEDAALDAIADPGTITGTTNGKIRFKVANGFLWMRLPSGRALAYANPSIGESTITWVNDEGEDVTMTKPCVNFWAEDPYTKKWEKQKTYGGSLAENATQAAARDIQRDAMHRLNNRGYKIVLHVHDEPVAEVPAGFGSVTEFEHLMTASEPWADGLPVAVSDGWRGRRYRKA